MATFDAQGRQVPDQRPVEVPVQFQRPLSIHEEIKRFVRMELSQRAQAADLESFEESDDFDVEDEEPLPDSAYELREMAPEAGDVDADGPGVKPGLQPVQASTGGAVSATSGGAAPPPAPAAASES